MALSKQWKIAGAAVAVAGLGLGGALGVAGADDGDDGDDGEDGGSVDSED